MSCSAPMAVSCRVVFLPVADPFDGEGDGKARRTNEVEEVRRLYMGACQMLRYGSRV